MRSERMKGVRGGRRPTKGRSGTKETEQSRKRDTYEQTKQRWVWTDAENREINQVSWQGKHDSSVKLFNYSRRLPFCGGILHLCTTKNQQRPQPTCWQRNGENEEAVHDKLKKFDKDRTVVEQGIKILWHPHYAIHPCELRDWSLFSWHPQPTICLLRWWVLEWEGTSMERERHKELCFGKQQA